MFKNFELTYKPFGSSAILIEWPHGMKEEILLDIMALRAQLVQMQIEDAIVGYHSLTLLFPTPIQDFRTIIERIKQLYQSRRGIKFLDRKIWEIPVYYGSENTDLEILAKEKDLSVESIVLQHTLPKYLVYFLGFQPGFLYLGGLNQMLHHPRRGNPKMVQKGAVAIGGSQTGIYPFTSIGGWHVIGHCPVSLFDSIKNPPSPIKSGDYVKFVPVSKSDYERMKSGFELKSTKV